MSAKEPVTDAELEAALEGVEHEVIDHDGDTFSVRNKITGSQTRLEAEDYSSALFEAWHLVKP